MPLQAIIGCIGILVTIIGLLGTLARPDSKWRTTVRIGLVLIAIAVIYRFGPDIYQAFVNPPHEITTETPTPSPTEALTMPRTDASASAQQTQSAIPHPPRAASPIPSPRQPEPKDTTTIGPSPTEPNDDVFDDIQKELRKSDGDRATQDSGPRPSKPGYYSNRFINDTDETVVYETLAKGRKWTSVSIGPHGFRTQWWSDPSMSLIRYGSNDKPQQTITQLRASPVAANDPLAESLPTYRFTKADDGRTIFVKD